MLNITPGAVPARASRDGEPPRASPFRSLVDPLVLQCRILFRREGSDDCFKARVAPQWVPERIETQIAVSNMAPW